jgi:hypothetical protein
MPIARPRQRKRFKQLHRINLGSCSRQLAPAAPSGTPGKTAPASRPTSAQRQTLPANSAGVVSVNTDSGVYHKPGTHWYGKTKQGKYMTEADAQKAGYRAAAAAAPKKKSN